MDVRVIAATNRDLEEAVHAGRLRADLFYRLNVFPLIMPPLRERASDIPQLAMFFLTQCAKKLGKRIQTVSRETMERLVRYSWPGNIRELQNVIERATVLCEGPELELDQDLVPIVAGGAAGADNRKTTSEPVSPRVTSPSGALRSERPTLEQMERAHVEAVLEQTGGLIEGPNGAARVLALHPNTLRSRMEKLGIRRPRHGIS